MDSISAPGAQDVTPPALNLAEARDPIPFDVRTDAVEARAHGIFPYVPFDF
jgi:hypothetical protein